MKLHKLTLSLTFIYSLPYRKNTMHVMFFKQLKGISVIYIIDFKKMKVNAEVDKSIRSLCTLTIFLKQLM